MSLRGSGDQTMRTVGALPYLGHAHGLLTAIIRIRGELSGRRYRLRL